MAGLYAPGREDKRGMTSDRWHELQGTFRFCSATARAPSLCLSVMHELRATTVPSSANHLRAALYSTLLRADRPLFFLWPEPRMQAPAELVLSAEGYLVRDGGQEPRELKPPALDETRCTCRCSKKCLLPAGGGETSSVGWGRVAQEHVVFFRAALCGR